MEVIHACVRGSIPLPKLKRWFGSILVDRSEEKTPFAMKVRPSLRVFFLRPKPVFQARPAFRKGEVLLIRSFWRSRIPSLDYGTNAACTLGATSCFAVLTTVGFCFVGARGPALFFEEGGSKIFVKQGGSWPAARFPCGSGPLTSQIMAWF